MSIRFVLVRPQIPENVGAVARALKNFGFAEWVLVDSTTDAAEAAARLAVQSHDVLQNVRHEATLEAAISDCVWVVGTTSRLRRRRRRLTARELAKEAAEKVATGPIAIVFGNEQHGLTNEELDRCHDVATILTSETQPSVNLAQAVLLFAYEARLALDGATASERRSPTSATDAEVQQVEASLTEALEAASFLRDGRREVLYDLSATLKRAALSRREASLWNTALRSLRKRLKDADD